MEDFKGKTSRIAVGAGQSTTFKPRRRKKRRHQQRNLTEFTYCEWDNEELGANMEFVSDSSTTTIRRQIVARSTDGAMCRHGYDQGHHEFVFEFTREWGSHCAVGLCKKDSILYSPGYVHLLGQDSLSWAFDIPSGQLFHRGHVVGSVGSMTTSDLERRIGMDIDFDAGRLIFRISIGHSFRICSYVSEELCQPAQPLYPVVSVVYGLAECTVRKLNNDPVTTLKQTERAAMEDHQETSPVEKKDLVNDGVKTAGPEEVPNCTDYNEFQDNLVLAPSVVPEVAFTAENHEMRQTSAAETEDVSEDSFSDSDAIGHLTDETMDCEEWSNGELIVETGDWKARLESYREEELMAVSELSEKNRLVVESFHGWDNICRGGLVFPHPGAPSICIPAPRLGGGVQAIRGKQGFASGRHRWKIRQLRFYSKNAADANDVFVGVVSSEHSLFNYGYFLSNVGRFAWCYQPTTKSFWHGSLSHKLTDGDDEDPASHGNDLELELELDLNLQTLTYFSRGKALATVRHVHGKQIYPFVIFHKDANFPVQILYSKGPADYLDNVLENAADHEKMAAIFNYQPQLLRSSSFYLTDFGEQSRMNGFHWGEVSPGVKKNPLNVAQMSSSSFTKPVILAAECSLSGNIHKVQWTVEAENQADLILGLVAEDFDVGSFAQEISTDGSARFLGDSTLSWGWGLSSGKLFHAGYPIAKYPIFEDLDCRAFNIYRMTVAYVSMNCSSVSFEIVPKKSSGQTIDLGMAFINVPINVFPAVMIRPPITRKNTNSKTTRVTMEYYSGSWMPAGKHPQSKFCSIL